MSIPPKKRGRFVNPHLENERRSLLDVFLWKFGFYDDVVHLPPMPETFTYPAHAKPFDREKPYALWIGHSSYLVDCGGWRCLTDPVWSRYCSPVPCQALERRSEPPLAIESLPPLDAVLISHNHYDHLDRATIEKLFSLQPQIVWIVPHGLTPWFRRRGIQSIVELDWWTSHQMGEHKITAVPAQHFSGRTLWDKNKTLWNGYVVESRSGKKFYFVGDTGYNEFDFKEIGRAFTPIDLSLIPIGTYVPRKFMAPVHSSPMDGVCIHQDVGSRLSLGMHWNTFRLSDEPLNRPPYDLYLAMQEKKLPCDTFLPVEIGVYVNW
ncbi:MAG: MBL fold metallo-hydrolase [Verrucomicrobiota bacterium]|nr:MBL fold metallo-hydrolase [Verrucomicrobiota bacterium]